MAFATERRIAYIDEMPCSFDVSTEAIGFLKTQTTCFVARMVTHPNREDTRRLRFSFFLQRCQTAGRDFSPFGRCRRRETLPDPLRAVPAVASQCIRNSHKIGGAGQRHVPQWRRLYVRSRSGVKRLITKKCRTAKSRESAREKEGFARRSRRASWLTNPKPGFGNLLQLN